MKHKNAFIEATPSKTPSRNPPDSARSLLVIDSCYSQTLATEVVSTFRFDLEMVIDVTNDNAARFRAG
jgi:hypothetical protein